MKTNAVLPPSEVELLRRLYTDTDRTAMRSRVLALRNANWPLRAIGDPLGVSRVGVRNWHTAAEEDPEIVARSSQEQDVPPLPLFARGSNISAMKVSPKVPAEAAEELRRLSQTVNRLRSTTAPDSPIRQDTRRYHELIDLYVNHRGVTPMDVARAAGVTRRTIALHLIKLNDAQTTDAA